jgi:TonB family protein
MRRITRLLVLAPAVTLASFVSSVHAEPPPAAQPPTPSSEADAVTRSEGLKPPVLIEFAEAPYPPDAFAQKTTGSVVLELDIDADGRVLAANVKTEAGHGFDEAAQEAALRFRFSPAVRDGVAIPSRILYRYDFTLKEAPREANPTAPPPRGALSGQLRAGSDDAPLAGALIELVLPDGTTRTVTTGADGGFTLPDVPSGTLTVRVKAQGYEPYEATEHLAPGEELGLIYRVAEESSEFEVTVRGERRDREVTRRTLSRQELSMIPGTGGDALAAVQTMPGVARATSGSNDIVTRGSGPRGTHLFVDGTFVPNLYHFGGLTSAIPTEMVEAIDFYPGNFSAQYGRVTGGVINVKLREMETDGRYHGLAQVDLLDARVLLRGPLPFAEQWSFVVAARRSHLDAWLTPLMEDSVGVRTAPVYYDWQAFLETKPTAKSRLRLGVFGADDRLALLFKEPVGNDPGFGNSFDARARMLRAQVLYEAELSPAWSVATTAAVGSDGEHFAFGPMRLSGDYIPVTWRGNVEYRPSDWLTLRAGPDLTYYHAYADVTAPRPPAPGEPDPGPYTARPMLRYDSTVEIVHPAVFAEAEWLPSKRAKVLLGGRYDYFSLTGRSDLSPRLNARYDLVQGPRRTTLKAGAGIFYEPPQIVQAVEIFGNPDLQSNRSIHYGAGIEQELLEGVELSVEGFYKELDRLVVLTPSADGTAGYENVGTGEVIGLESLLKFRPLDDLSGWVTYTLSRSTRRDGPGEEERLFEHDQTHNLTLLASYALGRGWQMGARFRYVSGNPYTPCTGGILQGGAGVYACRSGEEYSERVPAFHQLDVRVDKTWTFESFNLTSYLDLQNAYNRGNPEGIMYNYNYTEAKYFSGLPIIPSLGVRGEF